MLEYVGIVQTIVHNSKISNVAVVHPDLVPNNWQLGVLTLGPLQCNVGSSSFGSNFSQTCWLGRETRDSCILLFRPITVPVDVESSSLKLIDVGR